MISTGRFIRLVHELSDNVERGLLSEDSAADAIADATAWWRQDHPDSRRYCEDADCKVCGRPKRPWPLQRERLAAGETGKPVRERICIGCSQPEGQQHAEWCPVVTGTLSTLPRRDGS